MIPYPGDWHTLKNYQCALMKPYFDAGLKTLAKSAGYPAASIQSCGQFKRTHRFIVEVWEATYRSMISTFLHSSAHAQISGEQLLEKVSHLLQATSISSVSFSERFSTMLSELNALPDTYSNFQTFLQEMANSDDTWRFWIQFVFKDVLAYIGLFLAIRGGDWHLRLSSIKLMAPIFSAFDHLTYQRLISGHLADVLCLPPQILTLSKQALSLQPNCIRSITAG